MIPCSRRLHGGISSIAPTTHATKHATSVQRNDANRVVACGTPAASKENGVHTASTVCARQGGYP